ncbi:L-aspartate oxidase [Kocuria turfanensis]|uniref:L-aspartate oxidase n=1 Tax=Kocuria turfanensis TaxID=388357 RepID=A0A512ID49_9MICC|nr:L-aspartate oxidase [Kocuria turfanensis]GEO95635.1 L-aspartate oxidase [Kocuria turfanensis]
MSTTPFPRVLVVGSGIAGLITALAAAGRGLDVVLLSKDRLDETNTVRAQGGIAAMTAGLPGGQARDSVALHVRDTLGAGAGTCDDDAVRVLVQDSAAAITALVQHGVAFDRAGGPGSPWVEGLEGAHSVPRILHAGGDATGREIQRALVAAALDAETSGRLDVLRHTMLVDLVTDHHGSVRGALVLDGDRLRELRADAVVLATGGAGQLYPHTTNPAVATGDGIAAALRAGAVVADLEFVQFHPTALAAPGCFLVSEAVRGEGAVLRDATGRRFLEDAHPLAELAPRDVVAREIVRRSLAQGGRPVLLDCTAMTAPAGAGHAGPDTAEHLARRFPTIDAAVRAHGVDWSREPVPVTPAAHYLMGGITTDDRGRTSVPGLYAVGECAATGVHGANRLASNSLLEGAVFGARTAEALAGDLRADDTRRPHSTRSQSAATAELRAEGTDRTRPGPPRAVRRHPARLAPGGVLALPDPAEADVPFDRQAFQAAMWAGAGVLRDGPGLEALVRRLDALRPPAALSRSAVEDRNLLTVGRAVAAAALHRTESRGAHFREDCPVPEPARAGRAFWRRSRVAPRNGHRPATSTYAHNDMFERISAC